mmetsp:Transcript_44950/g.94311  ORF Transcript_44950/g.94311 Transcript_44950/m.94311 type:complete len:539 (+) Transcript_44950:124-1740(+)
MMKTPEEDKEPPMKSSDDAAPLQLKRPSVEEGELGAVSRRYDIGNKGFLDAEEQIVRAYDRDNDGVFTIAEAKQMASDLRFASMSRDQYRKLLKVCGALLVVSWAGNFGLTWATVALTRKIDAQGGDLTTTSGSRIATKSKGDVVGFKVNPNLGDDLRRLQTGDEALVGTTLENKVDIRNLFVDFTNSVPVRANRADGTGVHVYTVSAVGSQATDVDVNGDGSELCDVYAEVQVSETEGHYEVRCCGANTDLCDIFATQGSGGRRLERMLAPCICFSPESTVYEKTRGEMPMKDLMEGRDHILSKDGAFQPFVMWIHKSDKSVDFLQFHTGQDGAKKPLEVSPSHFLFAEGHDMPVLARDVKVGDSLVGGDGKALKVTKIDTVRREGFVTPLTKDATLVVDGILASSTSDVAEYVLDADKSDPNNINFGLFKVHIHTLMSKFIGPLTNLVCTKIDSFVCEAPRQDGYGDSMARLMEAGVVVLNMPPLCLALLAVIIPIFGAVSLAAYYLLMVLVPSMVVMGGILMLEKKGQCTKQKVA